MSGKSGPPMAQFRPVLARIAYRFVALQVDFFSIGSGERGVSLLGFLKSRRRFRA
jgi:hypothetical protein